MNTHVSTKCKKGQRKRNGSWGEVRRCLLERLMRTEGGCVWGRAFGPGPEGCSVSWAKSGGKSILSWGHTHTHIHIHRYTPTHTQYTVIHITHNHIHACTHKVLSHAHTYTVTLTHTHSHTHLWSWSMDTSRRKTWRLKRKLEPAHQIPQGGLWRGSRGIPVCDPSQWKGRRWQRGANSGTELRDYRDLTNSQPCPWNAALCANPQGRPASQIPSPRLCAFLSGSHFDASKENSNHLSIS